MTQWQEGHLVRMERHRFGFSQGLAVALGVCDLKQDLFKVTHPVGDEPPQVGEHLTLSYGVRPHYQMITVTITGIEDNPDSNDPVIYSFQRGRP